FYLFPTRRSSDLQPSPVVTIGSTVRQRPHAQIESGRGAVACVSSSRDLVLATSLECGTDAVDAILAVGWAHQLQARRQLGIAAQAARQGHATDAGKVGRQGEQIEEVHLQRVVDQLAELE